MRASLDPAPDLVPVPVTWQVSPGLTDYPEALAAMEARVAAIAEGKAAELIWLVEHPPLYTAGSSAREADLRDPQRFPVHRVRRGGQFTYHGPGQRVDHPLLQRRDETADIAAAPRDVEHDIDDALTGPVIGELTATAHAMDREALGIAQIRLARRAAGGIEWRMLHQPDQL
ncbi:MAG: hypothetical protein AAFV96_17530, partial [Pseudomonadota bacterium]